MGTRKRPPRRDGNRTRVGNITDSDTVAIGSGAQASKQIIIINPSPLPLALNQLPTDISDFTGRQEQLTDILGTLGGEGNQRRTAVKISALAGMAGVGKSTLAIHAAHQLKNQFLDAQLYADLRGGLDEPREPASVLASFLRALGVRDEALPKDLEGRASLYRSRLAEKRALVLLDNARDERQVRPLLPGSGTCAVLITSRQRLTALEGAAILELREMPETEAVALLTQLVGIPNAREDQTATRTIAKLCGHLPLAIRIAGARLKARRHRTLEEEARSLLSERQRLGQLRVGDLDVRASFSLSYRELPESDRRLFRLLGMLQGPDFDPGVASSLVSADLSDTEECLERLAEAQLVEPLEARRYRFHDLLRLFARECLQEDEPETEHRDAKQRIVVWYLLYAQKQATRLQPSSRQEEAAEQAAQSGHFAQHEEQMLLLKALAWFEREQDNLTAAVQLGYEIGDCDATWRLAHCLTFHFKSRGLVDEWEKTCRQALQAVRSARDSTGEAVCLNDLGNALRLQGRWDEAVSAYEDSLRIKETSGDKWGASTTRMNLGTTYLAQGRLDVALLVSEESLLTMRELGDRHGEGITLNTLGIIYHQLGQLERAAAAYQASLQIKRELGNPDGFGATLANLSDIHVQLGNWLEAIRCLEQNLAIRFDLRNFHGVGQTLLKLSHIFTQQSQHETASVLLGMSLEMLPPNSAEYKLVASQLKAAGLDAEVPISMRLGERRIAARSFELLGTVYARHVRYNDALHSFKWALATWRELGDRRGEANALNMLGNAHRGLQQWDEAMSLFQDSLRISREIGDRRGEGATFGSIGSLRAAQGRWDDAIEMFEQRLQIAQQTGDRRHEAYTIGKLAWAYAQLKRWDEAIEGYERDLAICRELGDPEDTQVIYWLATVSCKAGRLDAAIELVDKSISCCQKINDQPREGRLLGLLGALFAAQGHARKAAAVFQQALTRFRATSPEYALLAQQLHSLGVAAVTTDGSTGSASSTMDN